MSDKKVDKKEALKVLQDENDKDRKACQEEVNAILNKYSRTINTRCFFDDEGRHRTDVFVS